jgi:hypothetical protein
MPAEFKHDAFLSQDAKDKRKLRRLAERLRRSPREGGARFPMHSIDVFNGFGHYGR